jgi:hypothetical protein
MTAWARCHHICAFFAARTVPVMKAVMTVVAVRTMVRMMVVVVVHALSAASLAEINVFDSEFEQS